MSRGPTRVAADHRQRQCRRSHLTCPQPDLRRARPRSGMADKSVDGEGAADLRQPRHPTVEADIGLSDGSFVRGAVPSGASTGNLSLSHRSELEKQG
ncbi:hypothetical protein EJB05_00258 [Eragrostis curvula]|uniref:Uncharacterized protein n=1 Tax=Eragrostis curvula TaxID=38414 RepID=A0A5J9WL37_9POAL|nr:hypothetical protein EJB05_00258 [Eragrostis curvula]